ncbi:MAG: hypothetical protein LBR79_04410 [Oscillospiraceae bacterium]|nr:hypothetical protein [Oscillospiraceae bacterium]
MQSVKFTDRSNIFPPRLWRGGRRDFNYFGARPKLSKKHHLKNGFASKSGHVSKQLKCPPWAGGERYYQLIGATTQNLLGVFLYAAIDFDCNL